MKHAKWLAVVVLLAFTGIAVAQKIGSATIVTDVPFEFVVGNRIVPAGQCTVQAATMDGSSLAIRNAGAKVSLFSPINTSEAKLASAHYAMVFTRYGDRYFLSGIKLKGSKVLYRLPESKGEAELRARNVSATEEALLAEVR